MHAALSLHLLGSVIRYVIASLSLHANIAKISPQRGKSSAYTSSLQMLPLKALDLPSRWLLDWLLVCALCNCSCAFVWTPALLCLWLANDRNVLCLSQSSRSQTHHVHRHTNHQRLCVPLHPLHPRTHTHTHTHRWKKTVQIPWLRETLLGWKPLQWPQL